MPKIVSDLRVRLQYQKNMYIVKLDDIVNECNNTCHSTIKMKPVDVNSSTCINFNEEKMMLILNLKLVTM